MKINKMLLVLFLLLLTMPFVSATYNLTTISDNSTTVIGFVQGVNETLMFGWMGTFFLIAICIVLFTSFYLSTDGDTKKALTATAFISMGLSIFLLALGLVPQTVFFISVMLSGATAAFTWK